mgnify:CR=1 FL=1
MTQTRTRPRRGRIQEFLDGFRGGQTVDVDPSAIAETQPMPPQTMQGLAGELGQYTTTASEANSLTSLTMENVERMTQQISGSMLQTPLSQTATEIQLQRRASRYSEIESTY